MYRGIAVWETNTDDDLTNIGLDPVKYSGARWVVIKADGSKEPCWEWGEVEEFLNEYKKSAEVRSQPRQEPNPYP